MGATAVSPACVISVSPRCLVTIDGYWPGPWPAATETARTLAGVERSVLQGLAAFRWAAWAWMAAVLVISRDDLTRPALAVTLVALALGVTVMATALLRSDPDRLTQPGPVLIELAVGLALVVGDGWAYGRGHAFSTSQSLGSVWPLTGVLSAGVAAGPLAGAASGAVMGIGRVVATIGNGAHIDTGGRV